MTVLYPLTHVESDGGLLCRLDGASPGKPREGCPEEDVGSPRPVTHRGFEPACFQRIGGDISSMAWKRVAANFYHKPLQTREPRDRLTLRDYTRVIRDRSNSRLYKIQRASW